VLWAELARRGLDPAAHAGAVRVVEGGGTLGDAELNLVLNACDAGLHVSGAEGFGLGAVEHALTGAPQVFTLGLGDAAGRVLGEDRGYGVRPCGRVFTPRGEDGVGGWVAQLDAEEVAAAMWRCLTAPPAEREDIARRARAAVLEGLPWEGVAEQLLGSTSHP